MYHWEDQSTERGKDSLGPTEPTPQMMVKAGIHCPGAASHAQVAVQLLCRIPHKSKLKSQPGACSSLHPSYSNQCNLPRARIIIKLLTARGAILKCGHVLATARREAEWRWHARSTLQNQHLLCFLDVMANVLNPIVYFSPSCNDASDNTQTWWVLY